MGLGLRTLVQGPDLLERVWARGGRGASDVAPKNGFPSPTALGRCPRSRFREVLKIG